MVEAARQRFSLDKPKGHQGLGVTRLPYGPGIPGAVHAPVELHNSGLAESKLLRGPGKQLAGRGAIEVSLPEIDEGKLQWLATPNPFCRIL